MGHVFSDMEIFKPYRINITFKPCFNWATSFQTWKLVIKGQLNAKNVAFQLCHVFSDMEIAFL